MSESEKLLSARAYAKLNLTLQILYKRPDGYHEIESLVQRVDICDTVTARLLGPGEKDRVICEPPVTLLGGEEENTAYKALQALRLVLSEGGYRLGTVVGDEAEKPSIAERPSIEESFGAVEVKIEKRIPEGAGLGGASADAASTLVLASRLWNLRPDLSLLARAASIVGSDVPVCLYGPLNIIRGRGERVIPLASLEPFWVIVAFPGKGISTADAYARWDSRHFAQYRSGIPARSVFERSKESDGSHDSKHFPGRSRDGERRYINDAVNAITDGDLRALGKALRNDFEEVAFESVPLAGDVKRGLMEAGALGASLTGSGSAVFGLWATEEEARQALVVLRERFAGDGVLLILARSLSYR
ncbi:MAG TPA: 4-(cytidine 5'-diphospho)-2-C-methyl-D-erythritol kinase [Clostridia bacterium]|nr:4-(cytidine 5'-diphospho)-2-C-methyl-D-erythritol kinase [Clostridia bacterium]